MRKIMSILLTLTLILGLLQVMAAADGGSATEVWVGGTNVVNGDNITYWLNGSDGGIDSTDADEENYNVKFDPNEGKPTLTLREASIMKSYTVPSGVFTGSKYGIYTNVELELVIVGDNNKVISEDVSDKISAGIYVYPGNLMISGSGTLTVYGGKGSFSYGIFIGSGDLTVESGNLVAGGENDATQKSCGIELQGNGHLIIKNGSNVTATGGKTAYPSYGVISTNPTGKIIVENGGKLSANGGSSTLSNSYGIHSTSLDINGELTAIGASAGTDSYGIRGNNITISSGALVSAVGSIATNKSYGILVGNNPGNKISINGGEVTVYAQSHAMDIAPDVSGFDNLQVTASENYTGTPTTQYKSYSIGDYKYLKFGPDNTSPTVTSLSVPPEGDYSNGHTLDFTVNFDENVTVDTTNGTPYIVLTVGSITKQTVYVSGSGTQKLIFRYTVNAGDSDSDGVSIDSLILNGGTIQDAAGNNANLTLNDVNSTAGIRVNPLLAPSITSHPSSQTVAEGQSATFSVTANGTGLTYQWQVDTGSGFTNIPNGNPYSGTTTATLTIIGVTAEMSGYQYRAVVSGMVMPAASSNPATLTVNAAPTYSISGKVVDGNDGLQILSGAKVDLKDTSGTVIVTINITSGASYSFSNIPAGVYSIVASASGYVRGIVSGITVSNANITGINFDLFPFYPVTDITMTNPASVQVGSDLTLAGIVSPANATNQSIIWSIESANSTGATIVGSTFRATSAGTATVKATVANGTTASSDYTKTFDITVKAVPVVPNTLTGTATINNTAPRIGNRLTGSLVGGNNTGYLSYMWRTGSTQLGTGSEYIVAVADLGKTITLEITSNVETGTVTSTTTAVLKKVALSAPDAPTLVSKTHNTVILTANTSHEFSKDGTTWQTSNVFSSLMASTMYTFYQRIAETNDTEASAASAGFNVTTNSNDSGGGSGSSGGSNGDGGSSAGSSGDSGSSGTSSSDNSSHVIVTPPAKPNDPTQGEIKVPGTVDGKGNIIVNITNKTVTDAFDKALADAKKNGNEQNGITVVLRVDTSSKNSSNVTVNLPKTVQDTIIANKIVNTIVVVDNPDIRIGMDLDTVQEINKQAKSDVNITANRRDSDKLIGDAKKAIGSRPVFDLKVNYSNDKQVQNFGRGIVSVTIPYTLGVNEKAANVNAVYIDNDGNVHWLDKSVYDRVKKVLHFSTNHFSTYGVGYKEDVAAFTDIANHWAKEDIEFVVSSGLFSGTSATTFSPNIDMTRGMFVTALGRLTNVDVRNYNESSFSDVKSDAYYMGYIEWASKNNIVKGTGNGNFAPDQSITREQMAAILLNYAKVIGFTLPKAHGENTFGDSAKISAYAKEAVKEMQMAGILSGKNTNLFDPQATATRAEVAAVLHRFMELEF